MLSIEAENVLKAARKARPGLRQSYPGLFQFRHERRRHQTHGYPIR